MGINAEYMGIEESILIINAVDLIKL